MKPSPSARFTILACVATTAAPFRPAFAQDPLQAELRILTHNVWGKTNAHCGQRMRGFGHIVADATPAYDVVGLTEYYDHTLACDSDHLGNAIRCSGRYGSSANSRLFHPRESLATDGGQGVFSMGTICEFHTHLWSYQQTLNPRQGVILARIQLPNSTLTLDVYVVHIHAEFADDCDRCCRLGEIIELRNFIAQHSARSGNPVIVMGDFNIGGPPSCCSTTGYEYILASLGDPSDLWYDAHPCGQSNCGIAFADCAIPPAQNCDRIECDGASAPELHRCLANPDTCGAVFCNDVVPQPDCPPGAPNWGGWAGYTSDRCLNEHADAYERIDYIFLVTHPSLSGSAWSVDLLDAKVADFTAVIDPPTSCDPCTFPFCNGCETVDPAPFVGHVSDHLGVEATIQVFGRPAVWVDRQSSGLATGQSCDPFATVSQGVAAAPNGDRVLIRSGDYDEPITIRRHVSLHAIGGTVGIGR